MSTFTKNVAATLSRSRSGNALLTTIRLLRGDSHLNTSGWFRSALSNLPEDASGKPLPWYTYGAIAFLQARVDTTMTVFEYGSGQSTRWWAERVRQVVACEHHPKWFARMKPLLPANVDYQHHLLGEGGYAAAIGATHQKFDVVVIDGRERVECAKHTVEALNPGGVIVWDNSNRERYAEGYAFLAAQGFKRLDFWGMGPVNTDGWCTSVFYREGNLLGL